MRRVLRESQADKQRYREEAVQRLQRDDNKLQKRIDTMYVDKLDGRIDAAFFDQKQSEWREEQGRLMDSIAEHQKANESYIAEGIMLMELANRAADLFEKQPASEKRRLLDFVLSNSSWANGELSVEFRQPFGMIADMAAVGAKEKVVGTASDDLCLEKAPPVGLEETQKTPMHCEEMVQGDAKCGADDDVAYLRRRWPNTSYSALLRAVKVLNE